MNPIITYNGRGLSGVSSAFINRNGNLSDSYSPFFNLIRSSGKLDEFSTNKLNFAGEGDKLNKLTPPLAPVDIEIQPHFDGSVNVILNDDKNLPRIINSRFSVQEGKTFEVVDHKGNTDENLYEEDKFDLKTQLLLNYEKIPTLEFKGLSESGTFPCGSYFFYFTGADAQENESEVIQESSLVQCFIGTLGTSKVRMGLENEKTNKAVSFELDNLDYKFSYINVYYERSTAGQTGVISTTYHKINYKFPINLGKCSIFLTGSEETVEIDKSEFLKDFANIQGAKTQCQSQNRLFLGNTFQDKTYYNDLQCLAWRIFPKPVYQSVGTISLQDYNFDSNSKVDGLYYNPYNIYNKVGYWADEFYRFGIYFIFANGQISPVFNIQGVDLNSVNFNSASYSGYEFPVQGELTMDNIGITEPSDFYFDKNYGYNSKGVVRMPATDLSNSQMTVKYGKLKGLALGLQFVISENVVKILKESYNVIGYCFVRQTRIPTILAQGLVINKLSNQKAALPALNYGGNALVCPLLNRYRLLDTEVNRLTSNSFTSTAVITPEVQQREQDLAAMFNSSQQAIEKIYNLSTSRDNNIFYTQRINADRNNKKIRSQVMYIREGIQATMMGEEYFSTQAGIPEESYKAVDINHDWKTTPPAELTTSASYVRGKFGSYVGILDKSFTFGDIVNFRKTSVLLDNANEVEFMVRFADNSPYHPICHRTALTGTVVNRDCFAGDCFIVPYTYRLQRNFIDPELPLVTDIVNPMCWAENYVVRNTLRTASTTNNLVSLFKGADKTVGFNDTLNDVSKENGGLGGFANEIVQAFEVETKTGTKRAVDPTSMESGSGGTLKKIFSLFADIGKEWTMRGLSNINRADVNAVPMGLWITFPICSATNLSFRDEDPYHPEEEAQFGQKRSYYPLKGCIPTIKLEESKMTNAAARRSINSRNYLQLPDVPFFKEEYNTRIWWSEISVNNSIKNGYRVIYESAYRDYPKIYGSITKILDYNGNIICVCEHGILFLTVNERAMTSATEGGPVYIGSNSVLPETPVVISDMYGSMWKNSVIKTESGIFGVDTVAKKIWLYNGELTCISDFKVQKFLNDHLDLSEFDMQEDLGKKNVVTHYNAFKRDVIFTFYNEDTGTKWSLCYNLVTQKFTTFYDWYPVLSENIDNIFFSFDRDRLLEFRKGISSDISVAFEPNQNAEVSTSYFEFKSEMDDAYNGKISCYTFTPTDTPNITDYSIRTSAGINADPKNPKIIGISFYINTQNQVILQDYAGNNIATITSSSNNNWKFVTVFFKDVDYSSERFILQVNGLEPVEITQYAIFHTIEEGTLLYTLVNNKLKFSNFYVQVTDETNSTNKKIAHQDFSLRGSDNYIELWKHGQAGLYDNQGKIKPANWYGKQHEFNFEFIVNETPQIQKIFNNLQILSNKAEPKKFEFEVVGESYEWWEYKKVVEWLNTKAKELYQKYIDIVSNPALTKKDFLNQLYVEVLTNTYGTLQLKYSDFPVLFNKDSSYIFTKLPYMRIFTEFEKAQVENDIKNRTSETTTQDFEYLNNCVETCLIEDEQLNEDRIHTEQLGIDIKKYGRVAGNMQYLEDLWKVELRPLYFTHAYVEPLKINKVSPITNNKVVVDNILKSFYKTAGESFFIFTGNFLKGVTYKFNAIIDSACEISMFNKQGYQEFEPGLIEIMFTPSKNMKSIMMWVNSETDLVISNPTSTDTILSEWLISSDEDLKITKPIEARLRDKYLKVKVRYSGEDLAIIQGVTTLFDYSFA